MTAPTGHYDFRPARLNEAGKKACLSGAQPNQSAGEREVNVRQRQIVAMMTSIDQEHGQAHDERRGSMQVFEEWDAEGWIWD
jgi:hypothetical protein